MGDFGSCSCVRVESVPLLGVSLPLSLVLGKIASRMSDVECMIALNPCRKKRWSTQSNILLRFDKKHLSNNIGTMVEQFCLK